MFCLEKATTAHPQPPEVIAAVAPVPCDVAVTLSRESCTSFRAPESYQASGTLETGLVRHSIGRAGSKAGGKDRAEVDAATDALPEIASKLADDGLTEWERHHAR